MRTTAEKELPVKKSQHVDAKLLDEANEFAKKLAKLGIESNPGYRIEPALGGQLLRCHAYGSPGGKPKQQASD